MYIMGNTVTRNGIAKNHLKTLNESQFRDYFRRIKNGFYKGRAFERVFILIQGEK